MRQRERGSGGCDSDAHGVNEYREDDYLQLSGLQHFAFCRRQWALICIESQWAEDYRTIDGKLMHERAHNEALTERRGDTIITRGMRIFSPRLGITGQCDVLEFHRDGNGVPLAGQEGLWLPFPVEFKRGNPKTDNSDILQLCAQAMCLEEMLCCDIPEGAMFYGETRHRLNVDFTEELRCEVKRLLEEMHDLFKRGRTPKVKPSKACRNCSMQERCLPKLMTSRTVAKYIQEHLEVP